MIKLSDIAIFVGCLAFGAVLALVLGNGFLGQAALGIFGIGGGTLVGTRIRERRK
ncbi:hypothetical protein [Streptomyces sp. NPDC056796]|uniref:hypothetical protein n=1 Tax=unclassified Streptomyces TaxID=2593676 RepID=UPI0036B59EB5